MRLASRSDETSEILVSGGLLFVLVAGGAGVI